MACSPDGVELARGDKAQAIVNENEAERLFEMRMEEKKNMKDLRLLVGFLIPAT